MIWRMHYVIVDLTVNTRALEGFDFFFTSTITIPDTKKIRFFPCRKNINAPCSVKPRLNTSAQKISTHVSQSNSHRLTGLKMFATNPYCSISIPFVSMDILHLEAGDYLINWFYGSIIMDWFDCYHG